MGVQALLERVAARAATLQPQLVEIRRDFHRHPELGFSETRTAKRVADILEDLGLEVERNIAVTGVVATLRGGGDGPTFGIRADMDALPITEQTGLPFSSEVPGVMHACGHDCHVTMALGAAMALSSVASDLLGNVKFVFQPGEEGMAGGKNMVDLGVLDAEPRIEALLAVHMAPGARTGYVLTKPGPIMAAGDMFCVVVDGKGGHAAKPEDCIDPIYVATHIVQALQGIVSRLADPSDSVVISVTKIDGGTTFNVIPDRCELLGTVRTLSTHARDRVEQQMRRIVQNVCAAFGATGTVHYAHGYPVTQNDAGMVAFIEDVTRGVLGERHFHEMPAPMMGAEDFSYFLNVRPGVLCFLGCAENPRTSHPIHSSRMTVDERVLEIGARFAASAAVRYLHDRPLA